jgi:chemotaxis protein CheX
MERERIAAVTIKAAKGVFETMLGMEIEPGEEYVEQKPPTPGEKVVALIGLGGAWIGTGMMSCTPAFACKIASTMMMSEYPGVNEEVLDAMAEMANMIFGNVKSEIEEELGGLALSIPTVIFGRNFATRSVGQPVWTVMPVKLGEDTVELRICLSPNKDAQSNARPQMRPFSMQYGDS